MAPAPPGLLSLRRFELLTAAAVAFSVSCLAAQWLTADSGTRSTLLSLEVLLAKALGTFGALLGASAFERRDYMRRAWLFVAGNYFALLVKDLIFGNALFIRSGDRLVGASLHFPGVDPTSQASVNGRAMLVIAANVLAVVGTFMLARAWRVAGLELSTGRWTQRLVLVGSIAVAVALSGYGTYAALLELPLHPSWRAASVLVSDGADMIAFALMAPVLLTALTFRGGVLVWPWALYVAGQVGWMLFDTVSQLPETRLLGPLGMRAIIEFTRVLACSFVLVSGVAQRWAVNAVAAPRR